MEAKNFITLDVGTTTIRCLIINSNLQILGSAFAKVQLLYPEEGAVEIDPDWLWETIISVVNNALYDAKITASDIKSLGISTQRSTFLTWRKDNDEIFHNFITWKDVRSRKIVEKWNNSIVIKGIRLASYLLYLVTRNPRFLAGSQLKIACSHVTSRFLWAWGKYPKLQNGIMKNNVMFGTLDTWLLYKLTKKQTYVTDVSNASATGFFDPFTFEWGSWAINILKIPSQILPRIVDNDYNFGNTEIFGGNIAISSVLADQSASMLGACCFDENNLKITVGTGAFINVNTGCQISCNFNGTYPLVSWKIRGKTTYITEAPCSDCGSLIEWMKTSDIIHDVSDINEISLRNTETDGLYFIPAFSGLGPPFNDAEAASGFLGIKPTTTRRQMALAIIESIAYRIGLAFEVLQLESTKICIDGGVSRNDYVCQLIANVTNSEVEKASFKEIAALGVMYTCGLSEGVWNDMKELKKLRIVDKIFKPDVNAVECRNKMQKWKEAAGRFENWYK